MDIDAERTKEFGNHLRDHLDINKISAANVVNIEKIEIAKIPRPLQPGIFFEYASKFLVGMQKHSIVSIILLYVLMIGINHILRYD